jgi:hypothetical protein
MWWRQEAPHSVVVVNYEDRHAGPCFDGGRAAPAADVAAGEMRRLVFEVELSCGGRARPWAIL